MAERRMFSKGIIQAGKFLRMPPTARLLYYDLGMTADDDGIVEAYTVMTQTKATEDDLRILVAKGYVRILNEDLVAFICDWNTNNSIRGDRYHESIYKDLLIQLDDGVATNWQPSDNQMETEVRLGKDSIGKSRLGKDSRTRAKFEKPTLEEVQDYIAEKQYNVIAEVWFSYYESNGWKVGKNPMRDWKACIAQWNARSKQKQPEKEESIVDMWMNA